MFFLLLIHARVRLGPWPGSLLCRRQRSCRPDYSLALLQLIDSQAVHAAQDDVRSPPGDRSRKNEGDDDDILSQQLATVHVLVTCKRVNSKTSKNAQTSEFQNQTS